MGEWTYKVIRKWKRSQRCFKVYDSNVSILDITPGKEEVITVATLGRTGRQSPCVSTILLTGKGSIFALFGTIL